MKPETFAYAVVGVVLVVAALGVWWLSRVEGRCDAVCHARAMVRFTPGPDRCACVSPSAIQIVEP